MRYVLDAPGQRVRRSLGLAAKQWYERATAEYDEALRVAGEARAPLGTATDYEALAEAATALANECAKSTPSPDAIARLQRRFAVLSSPLPRRPVLDERDELDGVVVAVRVPTKREVMRLAAAVESIDAPDVDDKDFAGSVDALADWEDEQAAVLEDFIRSHVESIDGLRSPTGDIELPSSGDALTDDDMALLRENGLVEDLALFLRRLFDLPPKLRWRFGCAGLSICLNQSGTAPAVADESAAGEGAIGTAT